MFYSLDVDVLERLDQESPFMLLVPRGTPLAPVGWVFDMLVCRIRSHVLAEVCVVSKPLAYLAYVRGIGMGVVTAETLLP